MQQNKLTTRTILLMLSFGILLYWALEHLEQIGAVLGLVTGLLSPFLLGLAIAFVLNVPMRFLEERLLSRSLPARAARLRRPLALLLTLLLIAGAVLLVVLLVVPELVRTFSQIRESASVFFAKVPGWIDEVSQQLPELSGWLMGLIPDWNAMLGGVVDFMRNDMGRLLGSTMGAVATVFSGVFTGVLGFIFSLYILIQKETLCRQCRQVCYAFLPKRWADRLARVAALSNRVFSRFLSGQCTEAVILGAMFFVAMAVSGMPYVLMISVLVGFTALIPVFGAFIGCAIGAFLILMVSPMRALWFVVLFLVLQQIEGNLIYPRVVGGSIGLPSVWVLLAVTIGGSAMGVAGMLVFIPLSSVCYALLRETVYKRLAERGLMQPPEQETEEPPPPQPDTEPQQ